MEMEQSYRNLAVLANIQEAVCRVLEETGGNDFALVSADEVIQDVAACIGHCVKKCKGATV